MYLDLESVNCGNPLCPFKTFRQLKAGSLKTITSPETV